MAKKLIGGPLAGLEITGSEESKTWVTRLTRQGALWNPPQGVFARDFPEDAVSHGYRKQGTGDFSYVWSRPIRG